MTLQNLGVPLGTPKILAVRFSVWRSTQQQIPNFSRVVATQEFKSDCSLIGGGSPPKRVIVTLLGDARELL